MSRADTLKAIRNAGIYNDRPAFLRLYVENRVSRATADEEWRIGRRMAKSFADRADVQRKGGNVYTSEGPRA